MFRLATPFLMLTCLASLANAQQVPVDPASTHIFPAGGQRGTVVQVHVGGECLPPQTQFRTWGEGIKSPAVLGPRAIGDYEPSLRRNPRETPMSYPKQWQSTVEIAADAPLGTKLWRLSSGRGGSGARPFVVGDLPERIECESNSIPQKAERVSLPVTINGQIAGERDIDYFQFAAEVGDVITAEMVAARLGSPLEGVLEIHNLQGQRMPCEQLRAGSDPVLVFEAPASGDYRLFVANLSFRGGGEFVYRLTLTKLPYIKFVFPPGVQAGKSRQLDTFHVRGAGELMPQRELFSIPAQPGVHWLAVGNAANSISLSVSDVENLVESEPNDSLQQAMELSPDSVVSGQLATSSDEDWFRFAAEKDQAFSIDCQPFPKTSPALPVISIVDASGAALATAKSPEAANRICQLDWRAPAAGTFYLRVADVQQGAAGGPEFIYLMSFERGRPDFSLSAKSDFVNVVQGERGEIELALTRRGGLDQPIDLEVEGLPEGVRCEPRQIPANQNTIKIALIADAGARPTAATLKITGTAPVAGQKLSHPLLATHLGHDADGVGLGASTIDNLQLTVAHKPVFKLFCSEAYQYAHRGTIYPYLMEVERLDGFAGPIHLEVADRQIKDLDGIEVPEMTVPPDQTTFMVRLYLPETMHINLQAHSNVYVQGYVTFTDKWAQPQSHLVVSTMRCMVRTLPPVVKLQALDRQVAAKTGSTVICRLELIRTSNFSGPMQIELVASPQSAGYSAEPVTLAPGESVASIAVRVGSDAVPRANAALTFRATGSLPGDVQVISEAAVTLQFE